MMEVTWKFFLDTEMPVHFDIDFNNNRIVWIDERIFIE